MHNNLPFEKYQDANSDCHEGENNTNSAADAPKRERALAVPILEDFDPAPAATPEKRNPQRRPKPGTFHLLIYGR